LLHSALLKSLASSGNVQKFGRKKNPAEAGLSLLLPVVFSFQNIIFEHVYVRITIHEQVKQCNRSVKVISNTIAQNAIIFKFDPVHISPQRKRNPAEAGFRVEQLSGRHRTFQRFHILDCLHYIESRILKLC